MLTRGEYFCQEDPSGTLWPFLDLESQLVRDSYSHTKDPMLRYVCIFLQSAIFGNLQRFNVKRQICFAETIPCDCRSFKKSGKLIPHVKSPRIYGKISWSDAYEARRQKFNTTTVLFALIVLLIVYSVMGWWVLT